MDLKSAGRDGYGVDWPISFADLAPYYEKVETYIGVSGQAEGKPQLPDGKFLPLMKMTCGELFFRCCPSPPVCEFTIESDWS